MANIASVLKDEITRLARREIRSATETLRKATSQYRTEIVALKRRVATLEQLQARDRKTTVKAAPSPALPDTPSSKVRFSAKALRAQRQKLELSAANFGALVGVSGQSIYNWEAETTRPKEPQLAAIAALRAIGKRQAMARLEEIAAQTGK